MTTQAIHPTGVKLEPTIKSKLEKLGKQKQRSVHWLMKKAILQYIEQEEKAERLKQETLARWQEVEKNEIVSNDAMKNWLDTWGTDHETERPSCKK